VRDVPQPGNGTRQRDRTNEESAVVGFVIGMTHQSNGSNHKKERSEPTERAQSSHDERTHDSGHRAVGRPPHCRRHHNGNSHEEQGHTITTVRRIKIARTVTHASNQ